MPKTSCSHSGCRKPVHAKLLCQQHYDAKRRAKAKAESMTNLELLQGISDEMFGKPPVFTTNYFNPDGTLCSGTITVEPVYDASWQKRLDQVQIGPSKQPGLLSRILRRK